MRTSVRLDDELLKAAKAYASQRQRTLTSVLEEALRQLLAKNTRLSQRPRVVLPISSAGGGTRPGVDLDDTAALLDLLDDRATS